MPKKTKLSKKTERSAEEATHTTAEMARKTPGRASSRAGKSSAKKTAQKSTPQTVARLAATVSMPPTDEQIRLRAYFISERRHRLALPGDASSDWIEARRQLMAEAGPK